MKNPLIKQAKNTVKLGIFSMGGMGAMGAMQGIPGMPAAAKGTTNIVGAGLNLANIGQLAKTGMTITKGMNPKKKKLYNKKI